MKRKLQFCGAFNGTVALRPGESEDEAIDRVTDTMNRILERHARRLDINVQAERYYEDVHIEYRGAL